MKEDETLEIFWLRKGRCEMTRAEDHTVCEKAGPRKITIDLASKQGR
jgi:hypothetical protein